MPRRDAEAPAREAFMATGTATNPNAMSTEGDVSIDFLKSGQLEDTAEIPFSDQGVPNPLDLRLHRLGKLVFLPSGLRGL